jgi:hypothetical protein
VNLGQHGLCQADLERPEYIIAGALWVQDKGSPLRQPRFDGHLRKRTNNLEEVFDDKASESSSVTSILRIVGSPWCWPDELKLIEDCDKLGGYCVQLAHESGRDAP